MVETRAAPRYRVMKPAQIEYGGDRIACTVRDLSITGAALEISDPTVIPAKFTLVVPEDGLKLPCRVVRRTDFRIGVAFD
jgi:PilZ domain